MKSSSAALVTMTSWSISGARKIVNRVSPFLFDEEFAEAGDDAGGLPSTRRSRSVRRYTEDDLTAARAEGAREGHASGLRDAAAATEQKASEALQAIVAGMDNLSRNYAADRVRNARDTLQIALDMVRVLFPALHARAAVDEITAFCDEIVSTRATGESYGLHVHPDLEAAVASRIAEKCRAANLDAEIIVKADPSLLPGDCRLDWPGGGAMRETEALLKQLEEALAQALESVADTPESGASQELS